MRAPGVEVLYLQTTYPKTEYANEGCGLAARGPTHREPQRLSNTKACLTPLHWIPGRVVAAAAPPSRSANGRACCGVLAPPPRVRGALGSLFFSWDSHRGLGHPREPLLGSGLTGSPWKARNFANLSFAKGDARNAECKMHPSGGAGRWACVQEEI